MPFFNMRTLILTHPLGANYGGIMQCYALKTVLENMGHEVVVIDLRQYLPYYKRIIRSLMIAIGHPRYKKMKFEKMQKFIDKNFKLTSPFYNEKKLERYVEKNNIGAVFVGSDQVWNKNFAMRYGYAYFLSFVPSKVKKVAYAASIGTTTWEYDNEQTMKISNLLYAFSGISVREDLGVEMCKSNMKITPKLVLDPTFLLSDKFYSKISSSRIIKNKYIFVYWIWNKQMIENALSSIENIDQYEIVNLSMYEGNNFVSVEDGLSYIKYADIVITDSFHGCAFSIIFCKRFIYPTNEHVFDVRRASIFKMLSIDEARIGSADYFYEYDNINRVKQELIIEAMAYINMSLKKEY